MKTLPKYWAIKKNTSHPLWDKFYEWFSNDSRYWYANIEFNYFWYDWNNVYWYDINDYLNDFENEVKEITLEEWDSIVNWTKPSKNLSYETQYLRSDWILFTKDTIDWKNIEDLKQKMNNHVSEANKIRGLLKAHKNKF